VSATPDREHDRGADPEAWAKELDVSREAIDLYLDSEVIDLHLDSFIWTRVFGYDLRERHGDGLFGARFYSQVDFPRVLDAHLGGATWVITTNPARAPAERAAVFRENLSDLLAIFDSVGDRFAIVRSTKEYRTARAAGKHGAFLGVQGGNAFDGEPDAIDRVPAGLLLRVTLVHLSSSSYGATSSPLRGGDDPGLTAAGREMVERLEAKRIFCDLAHVSKRGFWDAVEVHDRTQPLLVTHTGVSGVFEHWRNLDDDQLRAIADSGGTVGIMYQSSFLGDPYLGGKAERVVDHLAHVVETVGEDHASLGSDWDGAILPPRDLKSPIELPRLVHLMLERGMGDRTIKKILGENFLRVVAAVRG
jgi:membrane dipeptidase